MNLEEMRMKKSSFVALLLGTISGMLFAFGMCMALIPEWDALKPGIIFGCIGVALAVVTLFVWRKMEHKAPIKLSGKAVLTVLVGIIGILAFGVGMCLSLVWEHMLIGILIGIAGIGILLSLIPLVKGIQ